MANSSSANSPSNDKWFQDRAAEQIQAVSTYVTGELFK